MEQIIGIIETKGLISAVAAVDSLLKNTDVNFLGFDFIGNGVVISKFSGTSVSIEYALKEGREQAEKHLGFIASVSIDSENEQVQKLLKNNKSFNFFLTSKIIVEKKRTIPVSKKSGSDKAILAYQAKTGSKKINKITKHFRVDEKKQEMNEQTVSDDNLFGQSDTIERLKREALGITEKKTAKRSHFSSDTNHEVEVKNMNVHELRHYVRSIKNFPIKGRQISRANRDELIKYFNSLQS